jgi:transposase
VSDTKGRPLALALTPGQVADIRMMPVLLEALPVPRHLVADMAFDADHLRAWLIERGTTPVIPNKPDRSYLHPFDRRRYKSRNAIERMFGRLKDFRRIATRYDRLATNYLAGICIVAAIVYWCR